MITYYLKYLLFCTCLPVSFFILHNQSFAQKLETEWAGSKFSLDGNRVENLFKLSPNREYLAVHADGRVVNITNTKTGHLVALFQLDYLLSYVLSFEWLDNTRIAVVYAGPFVNNEKPTSIAIYNTTLKQPLEKTIPIRSEVRHCVRLDSSKLLTYDPFVEGVRTQDDDDMIGIYDIYKGALVDSIVIRHKYYILSVAYDGNYAVVTTTDGIIRVIDITTKTVVKQLETGLTNDTISSVVYNDAVGHVLIQSAQLDKTILWNVGANVSYNIPGPGGNTFRFNNFSLSGEFFITRGETSGLATVDIYETLSRNKVRSFTPQGITNFTRGMHFLGNTNEVMFHDFVPNYIHVVDPRIPQVTHTLLYRGQAIAKVEFSKDNSFLGFSNGNTIFICDMKTSMIKQYIETNTVSTYFTFITDDLLAYTQSKSVIALYSIAEKKDVRIINLGGQVATYLSATSDRQKLLVCTDSGKVLEFDRENILTRRTVVDGEPYMYYCYYDKPHNRLITISQHPKHNIGSNQVGVLQIFDYTSGLPLPVQKPNILVKIQKPFGGGFSSVTATNKEGTNICVNSDLSDGDKLYSWDKLDTVFDAWKIYDNVSDATAYSFFPNNSNYMIFTTKFFDPDTSSISIIHFPTKTVKRLTDEYPFAIKDLNGKGTAWQCVAVSSDGKYVAAGNYYSQMVCFRMSGISDAVGVNDANAIDRESGNIHLYKVNDQNITISPTVLPCTVVISTLLGQVVLTREITSSETVDIGDLSHGFYGVTIHHANRMYFGKFIK